MAQHPNSSSWGLSLLSQSDHLCFLPHLLLLSCTIPLNSGHTGLLILSEHTIRVYNSSSLQSVLPPGKLLPLAESHPLFGSQPDEGVCFLKSYSVTVSTSPVTLEICYLGLVTLRARSYLVCLI